MKRFRQAKLRTISGRSHSCRSAETVHAGQRSRTGRLKVPPGNRLEALKGDRAGQYSIRINDQFRVCFRWTDGGADNVEITDYH
ncbi:MAG: plasmid maintenance system killer [Mesorhizobium sp.]|nr:MAG: plasmid maintenance system killer [Mesorhizobium sp.]